MINIKKLIGALLLLSLTFLAHGRDNLFPKEVKGLSAEKILRLANNGKTYAQRSMGNKYYYGKNTAANHRLAIVWYTKAAKKGDFLSQKMLGHIYTQMDNPYPFKELINYEKAIFWLKKSAASGYKWGKIRLKEAKEMQANHLKNRSIDKSKIVVSKTSGHSHAGRTHNHPLPKQGVKHRHGNGAYGAPTSGNKVASNKPQSGNVAIAKPSGSNNIIITHGKDKISLDSKYVLRDQHGCLHYNENINEYKKGYNSIKKSDVFSVVWHGRCKGGYPYGSGKRMWYVNGKIKDSYTETYRGRTIADQKTKLYNLGVQTHNQNIKDRKTTQDETRRKAKKLVIDKDLIKFAKKYNFNSLIKGATDVSAGWSPDEKSLAGVNGNGKISLYLNRSHEATAYITGKFKNGRLIGNAKLKVYASKCYKKGWVFCKVSEDDTSTRSITASSNIKKYVNKAIKNMLPGMSSRASRTISRLSNSSSSYSSSSIPYVMINFDSVCGFALCSDKNLSISGGPGSFSPSYSGADAGAIHKGSNGLAGTYNWSADFDNYGCSGSFRLSGTKKNLTISSHKNCSTTYNEY